MFKMFNMFGEEVVSICTNLSDSYPDALDGRKWTGRELLMKNPIGNLTWYPEYEGDTTEDFESDLFFHEEDGYYSVGEVAV